MRTLLASIRKEFLQVFRNRMLVFLLFGGPLIILGIIPHSLGNEPRIRAAVVDQDRSPDSRALQASLKASPRFIEVSPQPTLKHALREVDHTRSDMVIVIPEGFSVYHPTKQPPVLLALDASNTLNALDQLYYVTETWQPHMPGFRPEWQPQSRMLFNRTMEGRHYFVVSLLVLLITLLGVCFTSISVVNEKEKGILDQLNATPLSRHAYLTGKLIPFMVLGLAELVLGILFCHFVYGLQVEGSFLLLLLVGALFLMCMLGLGLLISTLSDNQVQAMYLIIFTLITLILLSTMFSQLGGMPMWAQHLRHINPIYLMLDCSRLIVLKGFGIRETAVQAGSLMALGLGILGLAVLNTRKTSR